MSQTTYHIHINGIVQGVGFRPFIYNLARQHKLTGWVRNSANGVDIEITGSDTDIEKFISVIPSSAPPLSQIDSIESQKLTLHPFDDFSIVPSQDRASDFIPVSPDVAICEQCLKELFDPNDRRYRYPFINCTNCGPRFTIIKDIPYDRPKTTMYGFEMCPDCRDEYEDPTDRRFHAQPVACSVCGPHIWFELVPGEKSALEDDAIKHARQILKDGKILAIKGLGGFHLACDATNPEAVRRLRERKQRPSKPFALMASNIGTISNFVFLTSTAKALLTSPQAPIVLLPQKVLSKIAEGVAPGQSKLGFMLAYTPLHQLLMEPGEDFPDALVMTSGNLSEEPILHENQPARDKLAHIADAFLMHNRPIYRRTDDSVYALIEDRPSPIRRARGFAPNPIRVKASLPMILAVGPQMKNTFCLTRDRYAFVSHYIGEMENWETYRDFQDAIQHFETLFRIKPGAIAYDMHPDYTSTKYAMEKADLLGLPKYPVQHHHAHLASAIIENGLPADQEIAGLIYDGTGYGPDGTIWGGEVLIGNCHTYKRIYHLKTVPLPGGDISIQKPARMALSTLWAYGIAWEENLSPVQALTLKERQVMEHQLQHDINTTQTSSMGRLFDAVSALIGVRQTITYEAQAAIELEALADPVETGYYAWQVDENKQINIKAMLENILDDISKQVSKSIISARFHNTIARISLQIASEIKKEYGIEQFALSGGVWQNLFLIEKTLVLLRNNGYQPIIHHKLPPNDGCVSFGQAMIAAYRYMKNKE
jgi:hydrogenase maturation protein HypF